MTAELLRHWKFTITYMLDRDIPQMAFCLAVIFWIVDTLNLL